jgi:hypothetical protein
MRATGLVAVGLAAIAPTAIALAAIAPTAIALAAIAPTAIALAAIAPTAIDPTPSIGGAAPLSTSSSNHRFDPSRAKVVHDRYVSTVELDGGVVTIRPAPRDLKPKTNEVGVATRIWATSQVVSYRPQALGFGLVTITKQAAGVPEVTNLPAWVGLASVSQIAFSCPAMITPPTQPDPPLPTPGDAAVVVGDAKGGPAVVYRARSAPCASVVDASLTNALETVSVPWTALGPVVSELLNVRAAVPACGAIGGIGTGGSASTMTVTIFALVPESPVAMSCVPRRFVDKTVVLGPGDTPGAPPPLVTPTTRILHGVTGPVRVVGVSPG